MPTTAAAQPGAKKAAARNPTARKSSGRKEKKGKGAARKPAPGKKEAAAKEPDAPPAPPPLHEQLIGAAGKLDVEAVRGLLAAGADAEFVHSESGTWGAMTEYSALSSAMSRAGYGGEGGEWREVAMALLAAGADPNRAMRNSDWRGCGGSKSPFQKLLSAAPDDAEVLRAFLRHGADPNMAERTSRHSMRTDGTWITYPLHGACERGSVACVAALLDAGADANATKTERVHNERGHNQDSAAAPLHVVAGRAPGRGAGGAGVAAAGWGDASARIAELLIARGASVNARARRLESVESPEYAALTDEERAALDDDPRSDGYVCPITQIPVSESPLHLALAAGNAPLVRLLMRSGADTSPRTAGGEEQSVVELAAGDPALLAALRGTGIVFAGAALGELDDDTPLASVGVGAEATVDVDVPRRGAAAPAPPAAGEAAASAATGMTIYLRFAGGETVSADLPPDATVGDLRRLVEHGA